jgi:hypothetical protein
VFSYYYMYIQWDPNTVYIRKPDTVRLSDSTRVRDSYLSSFQMVKTSLTVLLIRVIKNILFMPIWSRLVRNIWSGFRMVSAILFFPYQSRTQIVSNTLTIPKPDIRLSDVYCTGHPNTRNIWIPYKSMSGILIARMLIPITSLDHFIQKNILLWHFSMD